MVSTLLGWIGRAHASAPSRDSLRLLLLLLTFLAFPLRLRFLHAAGRLQRLPRLAAARFPPPPAATRWCRRHRRMLSPPSLHALISVSTIARRDTHLHFSER